MIYIYIYICVTGFLCIYVKLKILRLPFFMFGKNSFINTPLPANPKLVPSNQNAHLGMHLKMRIKCVLNAHLTTCARFFKLFFFTKKNSPRPP